MHLLVLPPSRELMLRWRMTDAARVALAGWVRAHRVDPEAECRIPACMYCWVTLAEHDEPCGGLDEDAAFRMRVQSLPKCRICGWQLDEVWAARSDAPQRHVPCGALPIATGEKSVDSYRAWWEREGRDRRFAALKVAGRHRAGADG